MIAAAVLSLVALFHLGALLAAVTSQRARLLSALLVIVTNYGWRRLLFVDPGLGGSLSLWFFLILLGDILLLLMALLTVGGGTVQRRADPPFALSRPAPGPFPLVDLAVAVLLVVSLGWMAADSRVPLVVRLAHWKDEYLYLVAYLLARLNSLEPSRISSGYPSAGLPSAVLPSAGLLPAVLVLALGVALYQALWGPTSLDMAWIQSGRSVIAEGGVDAIRGAHGLGNLEEGYLRPYGFFGNGTDFGVFSVFVMVWAVACRQWGLTGLCLAATLVTVVRFNWLLAVLALAGSWIFAARPGKRGWRGLWLAGGVSLASLACLLVLQLLPETVRQQLTAGEMLAGADSSTLAGRALVTGTWQQRWQDQQEYWQRLLDHPSLWLTGEGFAANGSAARKFSFVPDQPMPDQPTGERHNRFFDWIEDGGLSLAVAALLPGLLLLSRRRRQCGDPLYQGMVCFVLALLACSFLLGAKSALLQTLLWAAVGIAERRYQERAFALRFLALSAAGRPSWQAPSRFAPLYGPKNVRVAAGRRQKEGTSGG